MIIKDKGNGPVITPEDWKKSKAEMCRFIDESSAELDKTTVYYIGEKWTLTEKEESGDNTVKLIGFDLDNVCVQYIRKDGPLELMPRVDLTSKFLRHWDIEK